MLDVGLFHLMSVPPPLPLPTDEQPVTDGCKTSKPLGQQTIVITPGQYNIKNVRSGYRAGSGN